MNNRYFIVAILILLNSGLLFSQTQKHPRIYSKSSNTEFLNSVKDIPWKMELIEQKKEEINKYITKCDEDPEWLVSRLQMNWKTHHNEVFLRGRNFSHSAGKAPVPTVRFSGTRDWATDYKTPALEDVEPYFDDERGFYLEHKETGEKEWIHPSKIGFTIEGINRKIMSIVEDAAFLYWLTGEDKYAKLAEPVFLTYMEGMYYRDAPIDLDNTVQQKVSGLSTFEVIHEHIVVHLTGTFDFLHTYLVSNKRELDHSQAVFQKWGDQIIKNGIPDNNWNLFQARFLTYIALVLDHNSAYENGKGREYFLKYTFEKSTERQWALNDAVSGYDQATGMWYESPGYSLHVTSTMLKILTLLDNVSNKNEFTNFPIIEKAALASFQYLFPSGYTIGFGDTKHDILPPEIFELLISNYRKYGNNEKELVMSGLLNKMIQKGDYARHSDEYFGLFFYVNDLKKADEKMINELSKDLMTPTFYAPNVSLFVQRMGEGNDAMMVSTVGSFGNHAHVNGISMELYANNYALGPDMSKGSSYWKPDHREYYSQFPAHNTVVVDGISSFSRMRGYHPFTLDNHYPKSGVTKVGFNKISFSSVSYVEPETQSDQQRLTAMVKSDAGNGYIVDVFRSRKKDFGQQKHEYFYHNLGQSLEFFNMGNEPLNLKQTNELGTEYGDMKAYDYLSEKMILKSPEAINALFTLKSKGQKDNLMKIWIKGEKTQTIFSADAPKSNALTKGTAPEEVLEDKIKTLVLRRDTEAWTNPFALVFNPFMDGGENPVYKVDYPELPLSPDAQKVNVVHKDRETVDVIIANASQNDIALDTDLYQKGLLSLVRTKKGESTPDLLFVSGLYKFDYKGWGLLAYSNDVTVSIEKIEEGYLIQNDNPVVVKIPIFEGHKPLKLLIYKDGNLVKERNVFPNRNNANQTDFRLEQAFDKVIVVLDK